MNRKTLSVIFGVILASALLAVAPSAGASEWNQATQLTINQPFEVPVSSGDVVLGAGTYWFTVPDGITSPDLVHIFNADRTKLIATAMTVPTSTLNPKGHTELTFAESSSKHPIALISWFYPDRSTGHEFLYSPREDARLGEGEQITVTTQSVPVVLAG